MLLKLINSTGIASKITGSTSPGKSCLIVIIEKSAQDMSSTKRKYGATILQSQ